MEHTEIECVRALRKKHDVKIDGHIVQILRNKVTNKEGNVIVNPRKAFDLGNKSWGKLDYLVYKLNYTPIFVNEF